MSNAANRKIRKLDHSERWFRDGLAACRPPAFSESLEVDVSRVRDLIAASRERGSHLTYAHVLVRAAALALSSNPDLHAMVCGGKVHYPSQVDIALSVNAPTSVAPIMVIRSADQKNLIAVADEIVRRVPEVQEEHERLLAILRRWGWLLPFGFLRRRLLVLLFRSVEFRRKGSGTFQVSIVPGVDTIATPLFSSCAILTAGKAKDRVIALNGEPAVRPTIHLTCSADHRAWNGHDCQTFLLAVQQILQSGKLDSEISPMTLEPLLQIIVTSPQPRAASPAPSKLP